MAETELWETHALQLSEAFETKCATEEEFGLQLIRLTQALNSPVEGIGFEITPRDPFGKVSIGLRGPGEPSEVQSLELDAYQTICRISAWRKTPPTISPSQLTALLTALVKAYWKPKLRDDKSKLVSLQYPETYGLLNASISDNSRPLFLVLFSDIDNFKPLNDKYQQEGGDELILQFAAVFDSAVRPTGIPLHRSGDEFIAISPAHNIEDGLILAGKIMRSVASHSFHVNESTLSLRASVGIAVLTRFDSVLTYKELERRAVEALKPPSGKQRGKVRFYCREPLPWGKADQAALTLASCIAKSAASMASPFANPELNLLSTLVSGAVAEQGDEAADLQKIVDGVLESVHPELDSAVLQSAISRDSGTNLSLRASPLDFMIASAHGVLRGNLISSALTHNYKELDVRFSADFKACHLYSTTDDKRIASVGDAPPTATLSIGKVFRKTGPITKGLETRRALLVKIGSGSLALPALLFADVITIDDRPTRGGGLPDFWEATIARLLAGLDGNENIEAVYVLGDPRFAAQTIRRLTSLESWGEGAETLASKTGLSTDIIRTSASRLKDHVWFLETEKELANHLSQIIQAAEVVSPIAPRVLNVGPRFLQRQLQLENMALEMRDGCRVKTAAEAYPIVLEILRKAGSAWTTRDQTGQRLRELTDFRVHLSSPLVDMVPSFYRYEMNSLDEYFKREFLEDSGTFGKVLKETNQVERVVGHVVRTITGLEFPATTRRAILIIPNEISSGDDVAPLGLVCVRIVPRVSVNRLKFDFSFIWRTVEALVGFPYSLYGSIKYGEYLTSELSRRLSADARPVEMGELSYIAQSLHMFADDYGQIIARRIVDDASL